MPIYEYQCDKCRHHLEALQKLSDKPLRECPECGKHALRRLVSAPRFRLAGSGWYETDFKADGERKRNLVEKETGEASATAAGSTDAKADKPADTAAKEAPGKESPGKESSGKESSGKESSGKESSGRESSGSEGSSKRKLTSKPVAVAKPVGKPKPRAAAKPAARKLVRKR
jgi:putative FmdB family regulatory protein